MKYLILAIALVISVPGTAKAEYYGTAHQLFTYCFSAEHQNDKGAASAGRGAVINNELANPY